MRAVLDFGCAKISSGADGSPDWVGKDALEPKLGDHRSDGHVRGSHPGEDLVPELGGKDDTGVHALGL